MHKYAYMAWDRNCSYFCDNWRKRISYPPPPIARRTPKRIGGRAQLQRQTETEEMQPRNFDNLRKLCWQFLLINLAS